ncbi:rhamnan synthesis F family protein [Brevundimonas lutea]|uniref:rhamnan synthesis F family protein n=1 Tax=Brevundimonas lutea TaxID=2293980 RepID=UPI000F025202|nr:rhamnan synthesis F family protein [Brevundimonas lutea]
MTPVRGAFVLHLHYEDLALDLIRRVSRINNGFEVWATGDAAAADAVRRALGALNRPVTVIDTPNAGRDIGAFCFILPILADCGFDVIAKLHTKGGGSGYGREWRDHMLDRLATPDAAETIQAALAADPRLGLIGPDRLLKPVSGHMFRNRSLLSGLTAQLWPDVGAPADWSFFAGSMMWIRMAVLEPLVREAERLAFEPEGGVHDGRLEHAVERVLGLTPLMAGRTLGVVTRESGQVATVETPSADREPLIETLARLRQARIETLAARPAAPAEMALALRRNPLIDYLDGGAHDPNRLTHEAWRRDRRAQPTPSLLDWPKGPPASPITDGRGVGPGSLVTILRGDETSHRQPRWLRATASGATGAASVAVVIAPGAEARGEVVARSLIRLGYESSATTDLENDVDLNLVVGGHSALRPAPGPTHAILPLERSRQAAYAELDRYDVALLDPGLADLWNGIVKPSVGRLPRALGETDADIDRWLAAVLAEISDRLGRQTRRGARIRIIARTGAGGWPRSSAYLRLLAPLSLNTDAHPFFAPPEAPISRGEVVIVQRDALPDVAAADDLLSRVEDAGASLIFDVDDALHLIDATHPDHAAFAPRLAAMDRVARSAGAIWCATGPLADHYRGFTPTVQVIENRLDARLWRAALARRPADSVREGPIRLLYMGTATHDADLAPLFAALDAAERARPGRFALTLVGGQRETEPRPWLRVLNPPPSQRAYPRFVRWLGRQVAADGEPFEAGLAPLADTPFNAGKSDLKILDYAALGLAPVVEAVGPYRVHADAGHVAPIPAGDWSVGLEQLWEERARLTSIAIAARAWLQRCRLTQPLSADPDLGAEKAGNVTGA